VEVSGQNAEEVRSVAEGVTRFLMDSRDRAEKATGHSQEIERLQLESASDAQTLSTAVVISHSAQDVRWIETELIPLLQEVGIAPWYSKDDIRTAEYWEREILAALNKCEWFLIVLSPRSAVSDWVKDELHWAITNRKNRIIPVMIESCNLHDFHIRLARIEFVSWFADREKARKRILDVVCSVVPQIAGDSTKVSHRRWWEFWK
jgi:hypothetical protein